MSGFPASQAIGRETLWTDDQSIIVLIHTLTASDN